MAETLLMLQELACTIATQEGLDPDIFLRQIEQESSWDVMAGAHPDSGPGLCLGLGQLNPRYGEWFIVTHLADHFSSYDVREWSDRAIRETLLEPRYNLLIAAREMARLLKFGERSHRGTYEYALACYNYGVGNVSRVIIEHPRSYLARLPWETRLYLARVLLNTDARKERGIA